MADDKISDEDRLELYREHGCETRDEYLESLAETHGIDLALVREIADGVLGEDEDFDGLVVWCGDHEGCGDGS